MRVPPGVEPQGNTHRVAMQRGASWALLIAVPALALAGVFGTGPLSAGVATYTGEAFRVEIHHPRFARATADHALSVTITRQDPAPGTVSLTVPYTFLEQIEITQITPDAESSRLARDGITYEWTIEAGVQRTTLSVAYKPGGVGRVTPELSVAVDGQPPGDISFWQFVFP